MISAIVITRNEEENIEKCLETISWCDELIVIDDNSSDATVEIAKKSGARVFVRPLNKDFSQQRNYGLEKAKGDWILFIDVDERVSEELALEIKNIVLNTDYNGFSIRRNDFMWDRQLKYGETGNISLLRLAKKNSGKWQGKVHEKWKIKGRIGKVKNQLFHYPHHSITEFLKEINFYTSIRAKELYMKEVSVNFFKIIFYPFCKFLINYFLKMGLFDGIAGLIYAIMMSFHSFLVRGKLWLLWNKKEE